MKTVLKRLCALTMAAALWVTSLAGCGSKTTGDGGTKSASSGEVSASEENTGWDGTMPITEEPISITIAAKQASYVSDWNGLPVLAKLEERTNVHVDYQMVPEQGSTEKFNVMLAGNELPDAFLSSDFTPAQLVSNGKNGIFLNIKDLLAENTPNFNKVLEENPEVKADITAPDGNIYAMPQLYMDFPSLGVNKLWFNDNWLEALDAELPTTMDELYDRALHRTVYNSVAVPCEDLQSTAEKLVNGFTVVLFGQRAIAFETKTSEKRSPSAPEVENTVKGPKDAFTETVRTNTGLLRRHLRTPALRLYETVVGRRSLTNVTLAWIDGLTDPALVQRMQARLAEIDIDGLLTPAAVEEYLTGSRPTAFPLLQYTERTDRFAQALLEGRAGLLVDGLPLGYLAPVDLGYLMTSAEDRGTDFVSASFLRVLRYAALLLGLLLPGLYVAMAAFHPQMLPTELLQSILESKRAVPFPTIVEVLGLLAAFELLQEASVSLPQSVGQSLSIIGGLVVGSAAVEARLHLARGPHRRGGGGSWRLCHTGAQLCRRLRVWRMALAAAASLAGLFGLTLGAICLVVHLAGLDSFGISYLAPFSGIGGARALLRPRLVREPLRDPLLRPLDRRNQGEKR